MHGLRQNPEVGTVLGELDAKNKVHWQQLVCEVYQEIDWGNNRILFSELGLYHFWRKQEVNRANYIAEHIHHEDQGDIVSVDV